MYYNLKITVLFQTCQVVFEFDNGYPKSKSSLPAMFWLLSTQNYRKIIIIHECWGSFILKFNLQSFRRFLTDAGNIHPPKHTRTANEHCFIKPTRLCMGEFAKRLLHYIYVYFHFLMEGAWQESRECPLKLWISVYPSSG